MSRFGRKLITWIVVIVVVLGSLSMFINTQFVEKYYLSIKKNELEQAYRKIEKASQEELLTVIQEINQEESLFALTVPWSETIDELNDNLRIALNHRGINVKKLWVWEGFFNRLKKGQEVNQIYNQDKFNYSLLMKLVKRDKELVAIIEIIPHTQDVIQIINVFTLGIWISSLIIMLVVIVFFIKRLTQPLVAIQRLADDISYLRFRKIEVQTKDELEDLAFSINRMSEKLEESHKKLENKNKYMKHLLSDAAHELKTPISLIKAYGMGIQDGIDDGTFLETIIEQNDMMDKIVNQLLNLCRMEQKEVTLEKTLVSELLRDLIQTQKIYMIDINLQVEIEENLWSIVDQEALTSIWTNFITNAIKYTTDQAIAIKLKRKEGKIYFSIMNGVEAEMKDHLPYLWKPFYVGNESRNKALCGTGLGLYIVGQLLQKYGLKYGCQLLQQKINFYMYLEEL